MKNSDLNKTIDELLTKLKEIQDKLKSLKDKTMDPENSKSDPFVDAVNRAKLFRETYIKE